MTIGLTEEGVASFGATARRHVDDGEVPGVVALLARGDEVHVEAAGVLGGGRDPVQRDSLFRIASTTKPITAAATLALVDEGVLDLDEPVDGLLPELASRRVLARVDSPLDDTVPATRAITLKDLLTFTFGFGFSMEMFGQGEPIPIVAAERAAGLYTLGAPEPDRQPPPDVWLARLGELPLIAQPGERWLYNTGASVLGVLCARAAGVPFEDVLVAKVLEPLRMSDTAMWTADAARLATAYAWTPSGLVVWDEPTGRWSRPPAFPDGAAGLVSTVDDLHRFARMLLAGGDGVVSPALVAQMTTNQLTVEQRRKEGGVILQGQGWGYCQAVVTDGERAGAYGWSGGLGTTWLVDPVRDLVVIVLTQRMFSSPTPPAVHADLQAAAYEAVP